MARVFVTRRLPGPALDRLSAEHEVEVWPERLPPDSEELLARAPELEGLLTMLTDPVDAELIEAAPRLRAISNYAVGVDNVDLEAASARGIPVGNTPGVLTDSTADLAVALMLAAARRLVEGDAYVRRGEWRTWEPGLLLGRDLHSAHGGHRRLRAHRAGGGTRGSRASAARSSTRAAAAACRSRSCSNAPTS